MISIYVNKKLYKILNFKLNEIKYSCKRLINSLKCKLRTYTFHLSLDVRRHCSILLCICKSSYVLFL